MIISDNTTLSLVGSVLSAVFAIIIASVFAQLCGSALPTALSFWALLITVIIVLSIINVLQLKG